MARSNAFQLPASMVLVKLGVVCTAAVLGCLTAFGDASAASTRTRSGQHHAGRAASIGDRVRPRVRPARPYAHRTGPTRSAVSPVRSRPELPTAPENPDVHAALSVAARETGLEPRLLFAMAWTESRFDPNAENRRSTAVGLMQFTEQTWLETVRDHGQEYGLRGYIAALQTDPRTGVIRLTQPQIRSALLDLRRTPELSARLAAERLNRVRRAFSASMGRPVPSAELYVIHLLGMSGARQFLAARARSPRAPAARFASRDAVRANANLFYRGGRAIDAGQFYSEVEQLLQRQQLALRQVQLAVNATLQEAAGTQSGTP